MCGIVGYLDKAGNLKAPIGELLYRMLSALSRRGPDSAGLAIFGEPEEPNLVLRIKLGERGDFEKKATTVLEQVKEFVPVHQHQLLSQCLRLVVGPVDDVHSLIEQVESVADQLELVSLGTQLEIAKQVGSPDNLEQHYGVRSLCGTHGIGHTRLSTESRVDLSHSQPFWAHGVPDLATAHNGHITNYHKLRRQYAQRGIRFYTENDSELIGVYLRDQLERGASLEQALRSSVEDLDGSFSYLVASGGCLGYVKDQFALKPLMVGESDEFVAMATEEIALRTAFQTPFEVWEAPAQSVQLWPVSTYAGEAV
jgi:methylamine---glutamate N-methyltransferase subunit A